MSKPGLLSLLFVFLPLAHAETVVIPNEVFTELKKFEADGQGLSVNAVQEFPQRLHQGILKRQNDFFEGLKGVCQETVNVTFGSSVLEGENTIQKRFEAGLVRIEASKCYHDADPNELIQISASPEFKRKAFSTLTEIALQSENVFCETTQAPMVGKSRYCYSNFDLEVGEQSASQVSFLVFNDDSKQFDAPVYFREAFVSARRMGPKTLYYVLSYVRATEFSALVRYFAKGYIVKMQNQVFTELGKSIGKSDSASSKGTNP